MSRNLTESLMMEGLKTLREQLPTNTTAFRAKTGKMVQRLRRGLGALDMQRLSNNPGASDAMAASYVGSGVQKSYDADRAAGMRSTDAQDTIDFIRKRGSGAFRAQGADRDRSFDMERGMMKPYMQAYVGKGRQR